MLENVFNLEKHDKGSTFKVMLKCLDGLGYKVSFRVLNARNFGIPQNRERIIIVGNKKQVFDFSKLKTKIIDLMKPFLDKKGPFQYLSEGSYTILKPEQIHTQPKSGLVFD